MVTFAQLFHEGQQRNPLDNGQFVRSRAEEALSGGGITFRTCVERLSIQSGVAIVIAFYSLPDLMFLDQLVSVLGAQPNATMKEEIVIFDVLSFKTMADFEILIPGIGPVYQTPVVGIWRDGELVKKGIGAKGCALLSEEYGFD
jgi:hypothetical protein